MVSLIRPEENSSMSPCYPDRRKFQQRGFRTRQNKPLCHHEAWALRPASDRSGVSGVHQWSVMLPTSARVRHSFNSIDPLQGAAFCKGFVAKLHTARRCDTVEQLATAECIVCYSYHRNRHLDYPKLSTTLPCLCAHNPYAWFHADVAQAWHSCEGTFRNHFLRIHGDMDSEWNVSEWTPFKRSPLWEGLRSSYETPWCILCSVAVFPRLDFLSRFVCHLARNRLYIQRPSGQSLRQGSRPHGLRGLQIYQIWRRSWRYSRPCMTGEGR